MCEAEASLPIGSGTLVLPLFALPPKPPEWNGCVERANAVVMSSIRGTRARLTVTAINQERVHYQCTYNHYRSHDSLDLMTPMAYD